MKTLAVILCCITCCSIEAATLSVPSQYSTVQSAVNAAVFGDTVLVDAGTYDEKVSSKAVGVTIRGVGFPVIGCVSINHASNTLDGIRYGWTQTTGNEGALSILSGANSLTVISNQFIGSGATPYVYSVWVDNGADNITNLVLDGCVFEGFNYIAVSLYGSGHTITNCIWRNATNGYDCTRVLGRNMRFVANTFTNITRPPGGSQHVDLIQSFGNNGEVVTNILWERNLAINCPETQIGVLSSITATNLQVSDFTFRNNLYINVGFTITIQSPKVRWYNNTFYRTGNNTTGPLRYDDSETYGVANDGEVFNNIFFECGSNPSSTTSGFYFTDVGSTVENLQADYNLVIGTGAGTAKSNFSETHGINGVDPLFVNALLNDFRLQTGSPCINAGTSVVTDDYTGNARGSQWDIGAYKFVPPGITRLRANRATVTKIKRRQ